MQILMSVLPIVWLIISLGVIKMPAHYACLVAYAAAAVSAFFGFGMPAAEVATASLEGAIIALSPILIVVTAAIFTYNLSLHTGSMDIIKKMLTDISDDKRIQVLILAWGFGGFLEAVAGYGTAVAIPVGILLALGVEPVLAAVICLVANTAPTAFGAVGVPVMTLSSVTGLDERQLGFLVSIQLFLIILAIPFVLVWLISGSFKGIRGVFFTTLASGLAFALPQVFIAKYLGAQLPALIGSILSLAVVIWLAKRQKDPAKGGSSITVKQALAAWSPYILTFVLVLLSSPVFPAVSAFLGHYKSQFTVFSGLNAQPVIVKWAANAGILMLVSAIAGGIIQRAPLRAILSVFAGTLVKLKTSFVTVISIVALARVMGYSGMIAEVADALVAATGVYFVVISPLIGALGTFLTGSDTSSNVLFGPLQMLAAKAIGQDPLWLAAANTAGATAGKMISPQSIAVVASATGLLGFEGKIFSRAVKYCLAYIVILGAIVAVFK